MESNERAKLRITERAFEKAKTYARLVCEEYGGPVESIGFLLADPRSPFAEPVVVDVLLAHDQTVSPGSVQISPHGVLDSGREIQAKGLRCVGWYHVHPSATYHSATDRANFEVVLRDVSMSGRSPLIEKQEAEVDWDGDELVIRTGNGCVRVSGLEKGQSQLSMAATVETSRREVAVAYSLVLSADQTCKPYAEVATETFCAACGCSEGKKTETADIVFVDPDALDEELMRQEIRRKVRNLAERRSWPSAGIAAASASDVSWWFKLMCRFGFKRRKC